jgi:hypothetical protein
MNNKKILSTAIFLILAKSAWAIEVEPNNDSNSANLVEAENIGQLSQGSDVDFFQITPKDNNDISITFSCDNKALASNQSARGWYLGIHDEKGQLQSSYPVTPADCAIGNSTTPTPPYSFSFARGASSKFYVSVVADCHVPIYSKNPATLNITVNDVVQTTPATQTELDDLKKEIIDAKSWFDSAKNDLNSATFILIGANANFANISNALALANDILLSAIPNATSETTINAAISTVRAATILSQSISILVSTHANYIAALNAYNENLINTVPPATANANLKTLVDDTKKITDDALTKVGEAHTELNNAISSVNNAVNADIKATQASTAVDSRSNNSCTASNTAPYKIEVNKPVINPDGGEVAKDKTKIYSGRTTANILNKKNFSFKLTNCGLNKNAALTVSLKSPIAMSIQKNQTPINIQIGDMACQVLTPETIIPTVNEEGSVIRTAKIIDSTLIAKDSASFTLAECGDSSTKISITGTKLDFVDFNPTVATTTSTTITTTDLLDSVIIPVKIGIGDFYCEGKESFYIYKSLPTANDKTYSNSLIQKKSTTSTTSATKKPFFSNGFTTIN